MFLAVFKKEIHLHILSFRFLLCFAILLLFSVSTVVVCYKRAAAYEQSALVQRKASEDRLNHYIEDAATTPEKVRSRFPFIPLDEAKEIAKEKFRGVRWRYFHEGGVTHVRDPMPYRYLVNGVSDVLPRQILHSFMTSTLFSYDLPLFLGGGGFTVDLPFVIIMVGSLMAMLMSFDAVCGEKEDGTLKLELASPLPRASLFLAKLAAGFVLLALVLAVTVIVLLLYIGAGTGLRIGGKELSLFLWLYLTSLFFVLSFFSLGLFVSTCTARKSTALISGLFVWVFLVFVWPGLAIVAARAMRPTPTYHKVRGEIAAIEKDFEIKMRRLRRQGIWEFTEEYQRLERRYKSEMMADKQDLWKMYRRIQERQVSLASGLGRLSPAFSYTLAATAQAGTGIRGFRQYFRNLQRYQEEFEMHWDRLVRKHAGWRMSGLKPGWLKREEIAVPAQVRQSLPGRVNASLIDIVLLIFWAMLFFMLGFIRFLRYEA